MILVPLFDLKVLSRRLRWVPELQVGTVPRVA